MWRTFWRRRIAIAETAPNASGRRRAAFLDRDGVLNEDIGYLGHADRLVWIEGAMAAVARMRSLGFLVFVVTNQSGVARGFYDEAAVATLHDAMQSQLEAAGASIDAFRYCPHHPEAVVAKYRVACRCRKPAPGLLLDLIDGYGVDPAGSFLIGDSRTDLVAAAAAGVRGFLFQGGSLLDFFEGHVSTALRRAESSDVAHVSR